MQNLKKVILFNGPPRSGKDFLCNYLQPTFNNSQIMKFADPLKRAVQTIYYPELPSRFREIDSSNEKDQPRPELMGKTLREVQIALSEDYFKKIHGQDIYGKMLLERIKNSHLLEYIFVSDLGFYEELTPIINTIHPDKLILLRLHRDDLNYANDSRKYIYMDNYVNTQDVYNNSDTNLTDLATHIKGLIIDEDKS